MTKASQSFATHLKAAEIADFISRFQAVQAQAANQKASAFASCFAQFKTSDVRPEKWT